MLFRSDAEGIEIVASVHDEIIAECDVEQAEKIAARMEQIMVSAPAWANGLPLAVEGGSMLRYSK